MWPSLRRVAARLHAHLASGRTDIRAEMQPGVCLSYKSAALPDEMLEADMPQFVPAGSDE